jgi:hypothetical protein
MKLKRFLKTIPNSKLDWRLLGWLFAAYAAETLLWILFYDLKDFASTVSRGISGTLNVQAFILFIILLTQTIYILVIALLGKLALEFFKRDLPWSKAINLAVLGYLVVEVLKIACILPLVAMSYFNSSALENAPFGTILFLLNSSFIDLLAITAFAWLANLATSKK